MHVFSYLSETSVFWSIVIDDLDSNGIFDCFCQFMTCRYLILCVMYVILCMLCTSFDTFQEKRPSFGKLIAWKTGGEVFE